jgi:hypothetical protein
VAGALPLRAGGVGLAVADLRARAADAGGDAGGAGHGGRGRVGRAAPRGGFPGDGRAQRATRDGRRTRWIHKSIPYDGEGRT